MSVDQKEGKLKLIHIVWCLVAATGTVCLAIGGMNNQQKTNTVEIEKKLDKSLFDMHQRQQGEQYQSIIKSVDEVKELVKEQRGHNGNPGQ